MPFVKSDMQSTAGLREIYIEVDTLPQAAGPWQDVRGFDPSKVLSAGQDLFNSGLDLARSCAVKVIDNISEMDSKAVPDEFEVHLAIKLDAEAGAILAKASAGAQLQVTMKWVNNKTRGSHD